MAETEASRKSREPTLDGSPGVAQVGRGDAMNPRRKVAELHSHAATLNNSPRQTAVRELAQLLDARSRAHPLPAPRDGCRSDRETLPAPVQVAPPTVSPRSSGGLPAALQSGIHALSGVSLRGVRVRYNSPEPARMGALAYTQGADIHVGPGQERHLPHEVWHVVQQAQGRVRATRQLRGGPDINDDPRLEREADVMGARAAALTGRGLPAGVRNAAGAGALPAAAAVIQQRPADIFMSYSVPFRYDAGADKHRYAGFKGQRSPHAAQPINELRKKKVISTDPDQDLIGGHLLKAEYGGKDEPNNVVPWTVFAERSFTKYEAGYQKMIEEHGRFMQKQGRLDGEGNWEWPFYVSVEFEDWSGLGNEELDETLNTVPTEVTVNAGKRSDFFHITGKAISGTISSGNPHSASADPSVATGSSQSSSSSALDEAKSRLKSNVVLLRSRLAEMQEEISDDPWADEVDAYIATAKDTLRTELLNQVNTIASGNTAIVTVAPPVRSRQITHFTPMFGRSGPNERARREALDNPVAVPMRTAGGSKAKVDELVARFRQILMNNLVGLNQRFEGPEDERKLFLAGSVPESL
jgi:hypothetical protein